MGNIVSTLIILIAGNSDIDFFINTGIMTGSSNWIHGKYERIMDVPIIILNIKVYPGVLEEGFSEIKPEA